MWSNTDISELRNDVINSELFSKVIIQSCLLKILKHYGYMGFQIWRELLFPFDRHNWMKSDNYITPTLSAFHPQVPF